MSREAAMSGFRHERPNFEVELPLKGFRSSVVEKLITECPFSDGFQYYQFGFIAGRLYFRQWNTTLEAIVSIWDSRLKGQHLLNPKLKSNCFVPSDEEELSSRLKILFSDHIRGLLEGEAVQRCRKKIENSAREVNNVSSKLKHRPIRYAQSWEILSKRDGLAMELQQIEKRLEEFKDAMLCLLSQFDGTSATGWDDGDVKLFRFSDYLNWDQIHHLILRECRRLEDGLPIYASRSEILRQIHVQPVTVLIGETGSGKSTQLVQYLADSDLASGGTIVCTQPRKIAAMSLTQRVRGESDGCYSDKPVIFQSTYSSGRKLNSKIIFTTDNCLLQHFTADSNLDNISYIIVDEAHERTLNTDLLLALIKKLLRQKDDLRLVIMSATADASKFSNYFDCCTCNVMGRSFCVDTKYVPNILAETSCTNLSKYNPINCPSYVSGVVKMVNEIHAREGDGAILAFLTSQGEVEWACENFQDLAAVALPLHGKLSCEEQNHVFLSYHGKRKVIFATNLAETSVTIPGVKYVIDSGMVKESRFEPSSGMNVLKVCRISQSSAKQRAGRAGRTEPGKCYRLYSEQDFQEMPCHQEPEICKVHLGIAILKILAMGIKKVKDFDFVDAPSPKAIEAAIRNLIQLCAVTRKYDFLDLTDCGHRLVKLGIEPRLGKLILSSFDHGLRREGVVLAAVMANASNIFCRVGSDEEKSKSDCLKVQFCHRDGDLFTLLSVYMEWEAKQKEERNTWCWNNSINAKSMRRCHETVVDLENCLKRELNIIIPSYYVWNPHMPTKYDKLLKTVILSTLAENIAMYSGYDRLGYEVALTGQHTHLHPSCSLLVYGQKPCWVVFGEILSVSKQYLVCVTTVDYECLHTIQLPPTFDVVKLRNRKMQKKVIDEVGSGLLRRFCGKLNNSLHCLVSRLQTACMDSRIGIDVDFDKSEILLFAPEEYMQKSFSMVNAALEYEKKWLRDECIEKCLFRGATGSTPLALFGSGAEIKHLELEKRFLTVEVSHSNAHALNDKELMMLFDKCGSRIACFHKHGGNGQERENTKKWGKITFLSPDDAEKAVKLNDIEVEGSLLKVCPLSTAFGGDHMFPFPAVKAKVFWPRRHSKGVAIVRCAMQEDTAIVADDCFNLMIQGKLVRCKRSEKYLDCVVISGLDRDVLEPEILNSLRNATERTIRDVILLREEAVDHPSGVACAEALHKEIAKFMPREKCRIHVFPSEPKDCLTRALITFDGSLHLKAAMALDHIQGKVLGGCQPWQKIHCQHMFHSSVSCLASAYFVIKKQLDYLFERFRHQRDISVNLERTDNGSFLVKISSIALRNVAQCRRSLEQLMKGKMISHPKLTGSVMQLLFTRDGITLQKSLERDTRTWILFDRQNLNLRIFGPPDGVQLAEQRLVQSLLALHEDKQLEIHLRGGPLPHNLMKEVVRSFGADLHGLKEKVPNAEFKLNTFRHVISVCGSKESKREVEKIIAGVAKFLSGGGKAAKLANGETTCPICLCEVDEDSYRLEACGHEFCKLCLVEQCESAINRREGFPLCCTYRDCKAQLLLVDLRFLLSVDQLEELFTASLGAFVVASRGAYRFCPTPDCPSVYSMGGSETCAGLFACGACSAETCTKCHMEYHPFMSCEQYREFKDDPDSSLMEWCLGKEHVKRCPVCGYTIEKVEGCNHIECRCGNHICWACLECFPSSDCCYAHLRSAHFAII